MVRAGQAYAQGAWLHGRNAERFGVRESLSALFFGGVLPIVSLIAMAYAGPVAALILLVYPAQVLRIALRHTEPKLGLSDRMALGLFTVLGKFAECQGQIGFWLGGRTGTGRP
jgi:hypothetical protein